MFRKKFFRSLFDDESDENALRTRFVHNRIKIVEKHIPDLGKALVEYTEKIAKTRDCIDQIAEVLDNYAKAENVTTAFKFHVSEFATILSDVGTKEDMQVHAMETRVLEQLREHDKLCGNVQTELKLSVMANDKERSWVRQLQRIRENQFQNPEQISLAEAEYLKAKAESARSSKNLQEQIDIFETKRLSAIKETLLIWCLTELNYHAKALELFTEAYRVAADIDVNADVEEFRNKFRTAAGTPRSDSLNRSESVLQLLSLPFRRSSKSSDAGIPHPSSTQSSSRSSLFQSSSYQED